VQPNPVANHGTSFSLDTNIPSVRQHVDEAAVTVVRLFQAAGKPEKAAELRDRLIQQYTLPPEAFSK
jgi:hypothetical protein